MAWKKRKNKYNNIPTIIDGIEFHSTIEGHFYSQLKLLERTKLIKDLILQPEFVLYIEELETGLRIPDESYFADFQFFDIEKNKYRVVDVKGFDSRESKSKRRKISKQYQMEIEIWKKDTRIM